MYSFWFSIVPAIRSGDYYMFEDFSDDDIDLELSARHKRSIEEDDEDSAEVKEKGLNAVRFISISLI